jgi:hypothetical protein
VTQAIAGDNQDTSQSGPAKLGTGLRVTTKPPCRHGSRKCSAICFLPERWKTLCATIAGKVKA